MKKGIFYLLGINMLMFVSNGLFAQTVSTGRETVRGEVNFTELANYLLAHPETPHLKEIENEDDELKPSRGPVDPTLVRYRSTPTHTYYTPTSFLPVSVAPSDTFEATLDNNTSFPPDTHGCVDSNYCVTAINTSVHIQTRAGANVSSVSLDAFWNSVLPGGGTFDPRVHYDPYYHRWILVADANGQLASSCLLIGVSKTSNPTGGWWLYNVPIAAAGYWLDYPDVGFNQKWVVVTGNLFGLSSGYGGCKVYAFNYANLMSGAGAPFTAFTQASSQCIAPTITYDPTLQNIFAIESWNGTAGGGGQMRLWKITGAVGSESMVSVGYPASTGFTWQSTNAPTGDFAPQVGTANKIQNNDDRVFSSEYMNNTIWCSHTIFLPGSGSTTRASSQWWQVDTFGTPIQIGMIDDPTNANFYAFPSIAVNTNNDAIVGYTTFSAATHPSAAYSIHLATDPVDSMRQPLVYRHGQNTYYKSGGGRDRWGDYSACVVDILNMTDFWTIQEASANPANTWDTWWAYVPICNVTAAITPAGPTTFCAGGSVTLNATTGAGYTYQWKLGGAPISGATASSYTAGSGGNYTVVVTSGCSATSTATVVSVNPLPVAISGSSTVCLGSTTTLSDASSPGTWSSGATGVATIGSTSGLVNGISAGTANITFTLVTGCYISTTITVNAMPTATIFPSGPTTFCGGGSVLLNATLGAGYTYQWWLGGSPIAGATGSTYTAGAGGNYTVVVSSAPGCNVTSGITPVTVNPSPLPVTGTATLCSGATSFLSDGTPGGTWSSSNTSVATVSGAGMVTGIGTGGTANISYTISGCTATLTVTVNSATPSPISGAATVCTGQTITLSDATPGGTWSSSNTAFATVGSSTGIVTGVTSGTAIISYTISNACGTGYVVYPVSISNPISLSPAVSFTAVPGVVCAGDLVLFTAVPTYGGSAPSYTWTKNGANVASGPTFSYAPANGDVIVCHMTSNYPCIATNTAVSAPRTMVVQSHVANTVSIFVSQSTITAGSVDTFVAIAPNGGSSPLYQWLLNGATIPGATTSMYITTTLTSSQVISCRVTSSLSCATPNTVISSGITVNVIVTGLSQVTKPDGNFSILPNPNKGEFTIEGNLGTGTDSKVDIVIIDMLGQVVYTQSYVARNGAIYDHVILDHSIANGMYLVGVTSANVHAVYHVVVSR